MDVSLKIEWKKIKQVVLAGEEGSKREG